jgi:hypothetical protein
MACAPFTLGGKTATFTFDSSLLTSASYDLPQDVFEPGEKRPVRTKKGKSKGIKKATATNGSATPNGVQGGSTPNPHSIESTPTTAAATSFSKKRTLDSEVRQTTSMAECTMRRPYVEYRMLSTRESSLNWQAVVISRLPTITLLSLSANIVDLGC